MYTIHHKISEGSSSRIYQIKDDLTENVFAAKIYRRSFLETKHGEKKVKKEKKIFKLLQDRPDLFCHCVGFMTDREGIVMELYQGDLFDVLAQERVFQEEVAKGYIVQIVDALEVLHQRNIIYRDLKLENVLIHREGRVVLTDFGLSRILEGRDDMSSSMIGTLEYLAPEMVLGESYRFAVDWWQLGIFIYEMLVGCTPFEDSDVDELCQSIVEDDIIFPVYTSPEAQDLIRRLTSKYPEDRLTNPDEIREHPFFHRG
eukprot:TRINITY_DN5007_c0_g1_i1.p1 TRINITY_DN5007_c0_g1~~TRINITY_DN5007_c0_g1_i1.p1  ORF type:complete len:266 (-),score=45.58 TRINITY_DN5007_c0_g1_i1:85-858(-)